MLQRWVHPSIDTNFTATAKRRATSQCVTTGQTRVRHVIPQVTAQRLHRLPGTINQRKPRERRPQRPLQCTASGGPPPPKPSRTTAGGGRHWQIPRTVQHRFMPGTTPNQASTLRHGHTPTSTHLAWGAVFSRVGCITFRGDERRPANQTNRTSRRPSGPLAPSPATTRMLVVTASASPRQDCR